MTNEGLEADVRRLIQELSLYHSEYNTSRGLIYTMPSQRSPLSFHMKRTNEILPDVINDS